MSLFFFNLKVVLEQNNNAGAGDASGDAVDVASSDEIPDTVWTRTVNRFCIIFSQLSTNFLLYCILSTVESYEHL